MEEKSKEEWKGGSNVEMIRRGHGIGNGESQPSDVRFKGPLASLTFGWSAGCEVSWSRLTSHALWGVLGLLDFPCLVRELDGGWIWGFRRSPLPPVPPFKITKCLLYVSAALYGR